MKIPKHIQQRLIQPIRPFLGRVTIGPFREVTTLTEEDVERLRDTGNLRSSLGCVNQSVEAGSTCEVTLYPGLEYQEESATDVGYCPSGSVEVFTQGFFAYTDTNGDTFTDNLQNGELVYREIRRSNRSETERWIKTNTGWAKYTLTVNRFGIPSTSLEMMDCMPPEPSIRAPGWTPIEVREYSPTSIKLNAIYKSDCKYYDSNPFVKCAVNPCGRCDDCNHFEADS